MKLIALLAISLMAASACPSGQRSNDAGQAVLKRYELYSWQKSNGSWTFSVLPSPSGINISASQVFKKTFILRDANELKLEISTLPAGTNILWLDRMAGEGPDAKGTKRLSFPLPEMTEQIRLFAQSRAIKVDIVRRP